MLTQTRETQIKMGLPGQEQEFNLGNTAAQLQPAMPGQYPP